MLRSPILTVLGQVDAGKTSLLDTLRKTHVQTSEAGGITQQIGSSFFPLETLQSIMRPLANKVNIRTEVPGLLILDTPGHAAFTNLRTRGGNLCDMAILVVDIFEGLKPQTLESLTLLRTTATPFVIALNKIDRFYGWQSAPDTAISTAIKKQTRDVQTLFNQKLQETVAQLAGQSLNAQVYYKNKDHRRTINMVPVSAKTGDGLADLVALILQLTQKLMSRRLTLSGTLNCMVLEVKKLDGYGTTLDVILIDGSLHQGDTIVFCTQDGPCETVIRALLQPENLKEIRVKCCYRQVTAVTAAQCLKIVAADLENAVAGVPLRVVTVDNAAGTVIGEELWAEYETVMNSFPRAAHGVYVKASTLGSLEAFVGYLNDSEVPISNTGLGTITKKDIIKAAVMTERVPEYACILAFDLEPPEASLRTFASTVGVKILTANVMYQLFETFEKYLQPIRAAETRKLRTAVVYPVTLKLDPKWIFHNTKPIIIGCTVTEGVLHKGTPLVSLQDGQILSIGTVISIKVNEKDRDLAKKGVDCSIRLQSDGSIVAGRHFLRGLNEILVSKVTRESIDALKMVDRQFLTPEHVKLVSQLKKMLNIS